MPLTLRCLLSLVLFAATWLPNLSHARAVQPVAIAKTSIVPPALHGSCQALTGLDTGLKDLGASIHAHETAVNDDDRTEMYWAARPKDPVLAPRSAPALLTHVPLAGPWPRIPLRPPSLA
ncbi:MAG: hypothetical protein PHI55_14290 [Burkholderiaceae bacterium]|nr:hypothetical protein [Burkholderiaceae bacterium]